MSAEVQQQPTSAGNVANSCRQADISLCSNLSPATATSARGMPAISRAYLREGWPGHGDLPRGLLISGGGGQEETESWAITFLPRGLQVRLGDA